MTPAAGGSPVAGSASYDAASKTAKFTPSAALPAGEKFTVSVTASDTGGNAMAAPQTWSFTTDPGATTVSKLFSPTDTPGHHRGEGGRRHLARCEVHPERRRLGDRCPVLQGHRQRRRAHTGSLWSPTGVRLATANFVHESASGWQTVYFTTPGARDGRSHLRRLLLGTDRQLRLDRRVLQQHLDQRAADRTVGQQRRLRVRLGRRGRSARGAARTTGWTRCTSPTRRRPSRRSRPMPRPCFPGSRPPRSTRSGTTPTTSRVGMTFSSDVAGQVKGVRFYKGSDNIGTHLGSLWSASGTLLATGTFVGETGSGWQDDAVQHTGPPFPRTRRSWSPTRHPTATTRSTSTGCPRRW